MRISEGTVRLLKSTGKFTTVPIDRLCPGDLQYVQQQLNTVNADLVSQTTIQK